jgi:hypothetical protein
MPGYESKKLVTKRHADDETLRYLVLLRKENERLLDFIDKALQAEYLVDAKDILRKAMWSLGNEH